MQKRQSYVNDTSIFSQRNDSFLKIKSVRMWAYFDISRGLIFGVAATWKGEKSQNSNRH